MKKTINFYDFERAFIDMGRENKFSYEGKKALFEYLEEYEESTGDKIELDVIAICCDFQEFESLKDFKCQFGDEYETLEDIQYNTMLIPVEIDYSSKGANIKSFIIQNF
jgi:hypothetical protein